MTCKHCHQTITSTWNSPLVIWIHRASGAVYCYPGAFVRAEPDHEGSAWS